MTTLKEKFQKEPVVVYKDNYKLTDQSAELLEAIAEDFAIQYAEWYCARAIGVNYFKLNEEELEQFKKEKGWKI